MEAALTQLSAFDFNSCLLIVTEKKEKMFTDRFEKSYMLQDRVLVESHCSESVAANLSNSFILWPDCGSSSRIKSNRVGLDRVDRVGSGRVGSGRVESC